MNLKQNLFLKTLYQFLLYHTNYYNSTIIPNFNNFSFYLNIVYFILFFIF